MIRGYDIDGVITIGIRPETREDFIVTGRSYHGSMKTIEMLKNKGIFNTVYFNPCAPNEVTQENSANWKAIMIKILGIEYFVEDDPVQSELIKKINPNVTIRQIERRV